MAAKRTATRAVEEYIAGTPRQVRGKLS